MKYKDNYLILKLPIYIEMCLSTSHTPAALYRCRSLALATDWKNGNFPWMEKSYKKQSLLIRLTINISLFISKNQYFTLFSRIKLFFSFLILQTKKIESEMAYSTTATLEKLACIDYWYFGKCQDRFALKVFKKDENKQFRFTQNLTMGEEDFIQFFRLRNQLNVAVRDFSKAENLPPVQLKLQAKDMEEQLKLTHKVVEVSDWPHRKICVTMLRYNVEKLETSYVQVRLVGRRKDEEKTN